MFFNFYGFLDAILSMDFLTWKNDLKTTEGQFYYEVLQRANVNKIKTGFEQENQFLKYRLFKQRASTQLFLF